jgi:hypothetical protein
VTPEGTDPEVVLKVRDEAPRLRLGTQGVMGSPHFTVCSLHSTGPAVLGVSMQSSCMIGCHCMSLQGLQSLRFTTRQQVMKVLDWREYSKSSFYDNLK